MSLFSLIRRPKKTGSASMAKERLQILLAHERADKAAADLVPVLQREILEVVRRHLSLPDGASDAVEVKLDRGDDMTSLEINIELPGDMPARR